VWLDQQGSSLSDQSPQVLAKDLEVVQDFFFRMASILLGVLFFHYVF